MGGLSGVQITSLEGLAGEIGSARFRAAVSGTEIGTLCILAWNPEK